MRWLFTAFYGVLAVFGPGCATAADLPSVSTAATTSARLFVELVVNGQEKGRIVSMHLRNGHPIVAGSDLLANGIPANATGEVDLADLVGVQAQYDAGGQRLLINADPALLPTSHIASLPRERSHTVANSGALLNYDLYVQTSGGSTNASLWTEQRLFGGFGTFSNTGTMRISGGNTSSGYLRFDTRYRLIDEVHAIAMTAGDLITQSLPWASSVRLGGFQISRDFQVRPDLLTMPLPSFAGQTAVPSTVDLFVNGYKQQSAEVVPGRFVLDNLPVVNGAGQATIVTTDAVGRQVATTVPFYVASELLRQGLVDGSFEAGLLRRGYGIRSFDYGAAAASGTIRYGLNRRLTIEGHGEATRGLQLLGGGVTVQPGLWGVVDIAAAASHRNGRADHQVSVGYSYNSRVFGFAAQHLERSSGYRDLGSFNLYTLQSTRRSDRLILTAALPGQGSVGIAFIDARTLDRTRMRLASFSWSRPIGRLANLFLGADHDFVRRTTSAQVRVLIPFGRGSISAGASRNDARGTLGQLDYQRSIPSNGGLGIAASVANTGGGSAFGQATAEWRGRTMDVQAGGAFAGRRGSLWAGATGTLVMLDRQVYAANQVSDAFAVVSTDGVANVPISYENQNIGVTDKHGRLFVPSITAYHPGRFGLDPLALDAGLSAPVVERRIAMQAGTGAVIHMGIRRALSVSVPVFEMLGRPLAPGGIAHRAGDRIAEIGWDGLVFIDDAAPQESLDIVRSDGSRCRANVKVPAGTQPLATLAPVTCV